MPTQDIDATLQVDDGLGNLINLQDPNPLLSAIAGLVPVAHDEIALGYTGNDLTSVVYKAASVTVATLTLGYSGSKLTSVVRS